MPCVRRQKSNLRFGFAERSYSADRRQLVGGVVPFGKNSATPPSIPLVAVARAGVCDDHDDCGNVGGYISKANLRANEMSSGIENTCDLQAM